MALANKYTVVARRIRVDATNVNLYAPLATQEFGNLSLWFIYPSSSCLTPHVPLFMHIYIHIL